MRLKTPAKTGLLLALCGAASLFAYALAGSSGSVQAACADPVGYAGDQIYNSTSKVMQYCNAADKWIPMWGNSSGSSGGGGGSGIFDPLGANCTANNGGPFAVTGSVSGNIKDIWADGEYVYVADGNDIKVYNTNLTLIDSDTIADGADDVWVHDEYVFVTSGTSWSLYTFNGTTLTTRDTDSAANRVWSDGAYAYTSGSTADIEAHTFSTSGLNAIAQSNLPGTDGGIWGDGTYIFTGAGTSGINAVTFNGTAFSTVASLDNQSGSAGKIFGDGTYIYSANQNGGIEAYTFNGTAFTFKGSWTTNRVVDVWADGVYIYVATDNGNMVKALSFDGTTFTEAGSHTFGNSVKSVFGDGTSIYVGTQGDLYKMSGFSCTSASGGSGSDITGKMVMGGNSGCAIATDNKAYCWGANSTHFGVGDGTGVDRPTPVEVSSADFSNSYKFITAATQNACGIRSDDKAYCWGFGANYALGNNSTSSSNKPAAVSNGGNAAGTYTMLAVGNYNACGLGTDAKVYCWGAGQYMGSPGGTAQTPRVTVNGANASGTYKYLGHGHSGHNCAIGTDDKAYCWGSNSVGQTGNGNTTTPIYAPVTVVNGASPGTFKKIAAGYEHTCAIGTDDKAYCWGRGGEGQLGHNLAANSLTPVAVNNGAGPGTYKEISVGELESCGLGTDNKIYCWGSNTMGQAGDGTTTSPRLTPVAVLNGAGPGTFQSVSIGVYNVCGIATDNKVYCWGSGGNNQMGNGTTTNQNTLPVLVSNGTGPGIYGTYSGGGGGGGGGSSSPTQRCADASGEFIGGACWFLSEAGDSCDDACDDAYGLYDDATLSYTGSAGSNANCQSVLDALSAPGTGAPTTQANAYGCHVNGTTRRRGTSATTDVSFNATVRRACACKVGGDDLGDHLATEAINMNNNRIVNLGIPTANTDIATKGYVDSKTGASETDPQIGALTADKWCAVAGTAIVCDQNQPVGGLQSPDTVVATFQKAQGVDGGTPGTANTWHPYPLNMLRQNSLGAFLMDYGVQLDPGTYYIDATTSFVGTDAHALRLVSGGTTLVNGLSGSINYVTPDGTSAYLRGMFTLGSQSVVTLQYNLKNATADVGLGEALNQGTEVYGTVYIEKVD